MFRDTGDQMGVQILNLRLYAHAQPGCFLALTLTAARYETDEKKGRKRVSPRYRPQAKPCAALETPSVIVWTESHPSLLAAARVFLSWYGNQSLQGTATCIAVRCVKF
jgi:hypothetical protein